MSSSRRVLTPLQTNADCMMCSDTLAAIISILRRFFQYIYKQKCKCYEMCSHIAKHCKVYNVFCRIYKQTKLTTPFDMMTNIMQIVIATRIAH